MKYDITNPKQHSVVMITLDELRRFTIARNFFKPTTLKCALNRMSFVQADPIRAPARAQDLILRHRVNNYQAGDLERRYATLNIEEDVFINYGFVTKSLYRLMHPRSDSRVPADDVGLSWSSAQKKQAQLLLEFVRERGEVHPREVDEHFSHGKVTNYWGGSSNATTHLMDAMHYRGMLRVTRREKGIRIYSAHQNEPVPPDVAERRARIDALVDAVVRIYAPLPGQSLSYFVRRLRYAAPQWREELTSALQRAKERLSHARVDLALRRYATGGMSPPRNSIDWYWPAEENVTGHTAQETVRFVAPFDPLVNDRARFELLWGWEYRLEAYTPVSKRKLGYYAIPLLWLDRMVGWVNLSVKNGELRSDFGYVASHPPRDPAFKRELKAELDRMQAFLGIRS